VSSRACTAAVALSSFPRWRPSRDAQPSAGQGTGAEGGQRHDDGGEGEPARPGQGERQEYHVSGHVGDKDVAKDEVAERIHQARNHGHGYEQRWQRAVLATAARNDHLADLREEDAHRAALL